MFLDSPIFYIKRGRIGYSGVHLAVSLLAARKNGKTEKQKHFLAFVASKHLLR